METDNLVDCESTNNSHDHFSSNINASELEEETDAKLRGDAIGDTLYSQSFVLKTLLRFSDLKWDEEFEEDLCFLWDMTVEKDVCKYLFEISFPSLACNALERYTENRFIEIVIGILANILCADCEKNISREEINTVIKELNTDDHLILIQVVRFITALCHMFSDLPFISSDIIDKIIFILYNSTNNDLLIKSLEALAKMLIDFKLDKNLVNSEIVKSALTAYKSVVTELDEFGLDTKEKQLCCKYMFEVISNYCAYINKCDNDDLLQKLKKCSNKFLNEVIKILNCFSREENLLPITDDFIFYMSAIKFVLEVLSVNYLSDVFLPVTKILYIISDFREEVTELFDTIVELECFLIDRSTPEFLYKDLKHFSKNKAKKVLMLLNENQHKFDFDISAKLKYVSDKFN